MSVPAISATGLRKSYGDKVVLDGIDLHVATGTIFALLGPNGAGKTTTVNILSTLAAPDAGTASVGGHDLATDPDGVRTIIGLTGQFSAVDGLLTGQENLMLMADLHHLPRQEGRRRAAALLDQFELGDAAKKTPTTYSGGMRRKLDLAMTLMGNPKVIFLDEPTTGLDPRSRRTMWDIIRELVAGGVTILLTTQYLDEADHLADRIAVLDHGRAGGRGHGRRAEAPRPGRPPPTPVPQSQQPHRSRTPARCVHTRHRTARAAGADRRIRGVPAPRARPARRGRGRTRLADRAHPRPRRRVPHPHRPRDRQGTSAMTTMTYAARDSLTMLRRNLRHMQRYPTLSIMLLAQPILFLLMFTYIFGGTLGDGLGGVGGRAEYVGFVTPTILVITVSSAALGTAILVAMDMTEGIIDRFRTMNIFRASVLTGHVIGTFIQTALALLVVTGVAMLVGFESATGIAEWAGAAGILLLLTIALTWMSVGMGLSARSVESASNSPMIFTLLPFMGSGFVPTDSMPAWLRWFAEYQPFSPVIETVRGLLLGTPIGNSAYLAIGWCVALTVFGYVWSKHLYGKAQKR